MNFAVDIVLKPTLMLLSVAALSVLLRRRSAAVRHAAWILAMAGAILLPVAALLVPQLEWSILPNASTSVTFLSIQDVQDAVSQTARELRPAGANLPQTLPIQPVYIWVAGITFLLLRLMISTAAVRRMTNTAVTIADDQWWKHVDEVSQAFRIRRPVRLLCSDREISPMTWGVRSHTVLLPSSARQWSDERRRLVLAHELAHVKRNDGLLQLFAQIVCSVYWFNPLVWHAAHRMRIERERACDDRVLSLGAGATDYADHLVQVVRGLRAQRALSFASVSMASPSQLESRLVSILDSGVRRRALSKAGTVLLCTFSCLLIVAIAGIGIATAVPLPPVFVSAAKVAPLPPASTPAAKPEPTPQRTRIGNGNAIPNNAVSPPQVLESSRPEYTKEGVEANVEGTVTLEGHVNIKGNVSGLRVIKGLGYGLDQKAIDAVVGWKFRPALRKGTPVEAITQIEVDFRIPVWFKAAPKDDKPPIIFARGQEAMFNGSGLVPPTIISRVEPQYTEEARKAKYQGTVVAQVTVHKDGTLTVDEVLQELDYGLTPNAIEALEQWKFKPGMKNGEPVSVSFKVEVNFKLK